MRIVSVADTHTFHQDLRTIPDGDLFIHAGDLCRGGRLDELRMTATWLRALPHQHKIVIAGNHDWCFVQQPQLAAAELGAEITYLQDSEIAIEGLRIWGSPWQPTFRNWAFNLPRGEALASKWAQIPEGVQLLITHGPPAGIGDWSGHGEPEREGCADLLAAVRRVRPFLHLFGHIHQDGGLWNDGGIWFANVTCWEGERGATVIDLDISSGKVTPVDVPPARKIRSSAR